MNAMQEIAARKQLLIERSNEQRNQVAWSYYQWQARTQATRQVARIFKNPIVLAGIGLLALKMPWRRAFKMSGWCLKTWKIIQVVRRLFI